MGTRQDIKTTIIIFKKKKSFNRTKTK